MDVKQKFLAYENWTHSKIVIHKFQCGHANEGHEKLTKQWLINNHSPNDRWYGYFKSLEEVIIFASIFPERQMKFCGHCLNNEKENL